MTIIQSYLTPSECRRLSLHDNDYLRRKLEEHSLLNLILAKPINKPLLNELRCVLDNKPLVRHHTEQYKRNSKVSVFKDGRLVRIEHSNGKIMKRMEV